MKKFVIIILFLFPSTLFCQTRDDHINVHFYPHALSIHDILQDGSIGEKMEIKEDLFLIWVDLFPNMRFTHKTAYIFISKDNVRIKRGNWWPVLNGKTILYNDNNKYALISPFVLPINLVDRYIDDKVIIHVYPHILTSQDRLSDGSRRNMFRIGDNCLLIWIDFMPSAYFAHPTAYVLISKDFTRVEYGNWWPTLNGKTILYGQQNQIGILSPFKIK